MGEGAGVVVLEEYEHAKARGAKIYGEVLGYGMSGDAHHITAPAEDGDGAYRAMKAALASAGLNPDDIDYVNCTRDLDPAWRRNRSRRSQAALRRAAADNLSMSSTKSSIGHLLGAAGSVEAIFTTLAIRDGVAPATLNLEDPSDGCDLDLVPHTAKERPIRNAMSNSFGFGGTNASLVIGGLDGR